MTRAGTDALQVSITCAMMAKPSTMYMIRAEKPECGRVWHIKRTFGEFHEFRGRLLGLLDAVECTQTKTNITLQSHQLVSFLINSEFPRRQMLFTKSKKVVRERLDALNQFLQSTLALLPHLREKGHVATYFGMRSMLESFIDSSNTPPRPRSFKRLWSRASSPESMTRPASMTAADSAIPRDEHGAKEHNLSIPWKYGYKKLFLRNSAMEHDCVWQQGRSRTSWGGEYQAPGKTTRMRLEHTQKQPLCFTHASTLAEAAEAAANAILAHRMHCKSTGEDSIPASCTWSKAEQTGFPKAESSPRAATAC
uniref:Uncharacterized protein AlNc14C86G5524 n=1 Tax=Albugo laibachii Nc14 TaxID=890382 RepID=F0WFZ1_9STRA|nr:conserved hypothetical protein [Albugo laibachii Nc14]|eukprot:CCA20125.1 conserved hypothetical protein [Albugo laibachii Nc14]